MTETQTGSWGSSECEIIASIAKLLTAPASAATPGGKSRYILRGEFFFFFFYSSPDSSHTL